MTAGFLLPGHAPGDGLLHGLDARAKLLAAAALAAASVVAERPAAHLGLLGLVLGLHALARVSWVRFARGLRGAVWLAGFVIAANLGWWFFARATGMPAGEGAVARPGALFVLVARLLTLLALAGLVTATTVPVDAAEAIERLLRPLARLRVPVHELGFLLVLALSFVPLFGREAARLAAAHRVKRGQARWSRGDRIRAVVPLLVPLFLAVLRRADELAVALDARCFEPGAPRTSLVPGRFGPAEGATLALGGAAFAAACLLGRA